MNETRRRFQRVPLSPRQRAIRKRFLAAVIITCITAVMVGGGLHVMTLGEARLAQMRDKASYDVSEVDKHIRAAGEDLARHAENEHGNAKAAYTLDAARALLDAKTWKKLDAMVTVPAGPFRMGTNLFRADDQDKPEHEVALPAFRIDKYPVTNAQYARFLAETGHRPPSSWDKGVIPQGAKLQPVTLVSWYDAKAYCQWAHKHLPTEAQWEKAARGNDGRRWPWGNAMDPARLNTYYSVGHPTNVLKYPQGASPYGAMDMAGNVYEWVADDFAPYEGSKADADLFKVKLPKVTSAEDRSKKTVELVVYDNLKYKVLRGGSWNSDPFSTATYHRNYELPNKASDFIGFRCAAPLADRGGHR